MSYRVIDPFAVYFDQAARALDGGQLRFYEAGTTTPKAVFADPGLTIPNGSTVDLDSAGRPEVAAWGSGNYRVRLFDALGALVLEVDPITDPAASSGLAIPALVIDAFLTNDGSNLLWQLIRQLPDPTGQNGKYLSTDGANAVWASLPAVAQPAITLTANSARFGVPGADYFMIQWGSDTAPASGSERTSKTITFPTAMTSTYHVSVTPTSPSQPNGPVVVELASAPGATGFTVEFDLAEGDIGSTSIVNPVPFSWVAFGKVPEPS